MRAVGIGGTRGPCPPPIICTNMPSPPKKKKKKKIFFLKINLWITPVIFTSMPLKISTIVPYYGFHICALEQFNICAPNVSPFHFHSCDPYCFHICALDNFHRCHPPSIIFTSVPRATCVRQIISISLPPSFSYLSLNKFRICALKFSYLCPPPPPKWFFKKICVPPPPPNL